MILNKSDMLQPNEADYLENQNSRHTIDKIPVLCFVAEKLHSQNGADAAAEQSREKQSFFRNAPFMLNRFLLVYSH